MALRAWAVAAAFVTASVALVGSIARGSTVEEPAFAVEATHDGWEIRRYGPKLEAQVSVTGPYDSAVRDGFKVLAGYIFGANLPRTEIAMTAPVGAKRIEGQRIAMTAPVAATAAGEAAWIVSFTMPSSWTQATLPVPTDPRVKLVAIEGGRVAARVFSGWATAARVAEHQATLLEAVRAAGLHAGTPTVAQYNPPWTLPPLRRNEILVPLLAPDEPGSAARDSDREAR